VDKDLTAALLARALNADALLLLTDVDAVIDGFDTPSARPIRHATPSELRARSFPAGSMGPKVEAACRFVEATGRMAAIGRLDTAPALLRGATGTIVSPAADARQTGQGQTSPLTREMRDHEILVRPDVPGPAAGPEPAPAPA
jgi:carbamate kinase